jgi:hypothetical protein
VTFNFFFFFFFTFFLPSSTQHQKQKNLLLLSVSFSLSALFSSCFLSFSRAFLRYNIPNDYVLIGIEVAKILNLEKLNNNGSFEKLLFL